VAIPRMYSHIQLVVPAGAVNCAGIADARSQIGKRSRAQRDSATKQYQGRGELDETGVDVTRFETAEIVA
jgi:hypothetical protein